jgi:hypothetical protein
MYIKLNNGVPERYSVRQLRRDNPNTSFPQDIPDDVLAEYGVYPLAPIEQPSFDPAVERPAEGTPVLQNGKWVQTWDLVPLTPEELAERAEQHRMMVIQQRAEAYRQEADPLFFKAQRGEVDQQVWLDKVAEIRARHPTDT